MDLWVHIDLYADAHGGWRIQAVAIASGSFTSRLPLPESWCGLRDDALSAESGIEGCIFAHASGFIGGNKTLDGARRMAARSIALAAVAGGEAAATAPAPPKKLKS